MGRHENISSLQQTDHSRDCHSFKVNDLTDDFVVRNSGLLREPQKLQLQVVRFAELIIAFPISHQEHELAVGCIGRRRLRGTNRIKGVFSNQESTGKLIDRHRRRNNTAEHDHVLFSYVDVFGVQVTLVQKLEFHVMLLEQMQVVSKEGRLLGAVDVLEDFRGEKRGRVHLPVRCGTLLGLNRLFRVTCRFGREFGHRVGAHSFQCDDEERNVRVEMMLLRDSRLCQLEKIQMMRFCTRPENLELVSLMRHRCLRLKVVLQRESVVLLIVHQPATLDHGFQRCHRLWKQQGAR
mmetsp:Transcript_18771/g.47201  ORF Transcript_18771/g.47201 Transcript_18771/m.47201 type:complete len:293 (+) Transcript_18771:1189-2067(+)